jgi:hypothetical protein
MHPYQGIPIRRVSTTPRIAGVMPRRPNLRLAGRSRARTELARRTHRRAALTWSDTIGRARTGDQAYCGNSSATSRLLARLGTGDDRRQLPPTVQRFKM